MKTMKTTFLVMIATLAASVVMASGNLKVNLASNDSESALVEISNSKMVNYEIELIDEVGNELYSMETEAPRSELRKRYDFTNLEDGTYWYSVKIDNEEITKRLAIQNGMVEVTDIRKTVEPYFHKEGDMVKLTFLNFESENIKMFVYDENYDLLTEANLGNDFTIHKVVNLADLNPGIYDLVLANDYEVFQHTIELD
jgi:hypothetical protein